MSQALAEATDTSVLSDAIRDGLLQDLIAISLIVHGAEQTASADVARCLASVSTTIEADVRVVRELIDRLRMAA